MAASAKARAYESRYPGTGIPEAQKEERMDRLSFREERQAGHRTMRNRGVVLSGRAGETWERVFGRETA